LENLIVIPSNQDNQMDVARLEEAMEQSLYTNARIGPIFATMGTTDAFGIDPLCDIIELRDCFARRVGYGIHVHADAVIGWPFLIFREDESLHGLPQRLASEIRHIATRMTDLRLADSIGIDFHKTGWAPYLCSAFLTRDRRDLMLLERQQEDMPYLYHSGAYHPGRYTLESSRPNYGQKAVMNMLLLGREGYGTLIAHLLSVADHLRDRIVESHDIALLNRHNPAFVTDFRVYPHSKYARDGRLLADKELDDEIAPEYTQSINEYNRQIVEYMQAEIGSAEAALLSYSDSYRTTQQRSLVAIKSYPMSPFIEAVHMDEVLAALYQAKEAVDHCPVPEWFEAFGNG
jgi:glutamate/tyrosine decarboxylase-like PLP-dependent enzyme